MLEEESKRHCLRKADYAGNEGKAEYKRQSEHGPCQRGLQYFCERQGKNESLVNAIQTRLKRSAISGLSYQISYWNRVITGQNAL